jgi:geranylgeranyl pyrophosphate synthase
VKNLNTGNYHVRGTSPSSVLDETDFDDRHDRHVNEASGLLPEGAGLRRMLGFDNSGAVEDILRRALMNPIKEMTENQGKRIRGQLVPLGFRLLSDTGGYSAVARRRCRICAEVVELIHAGSLIVDDIEDGSVTRRGRPALHVQYGLPVALNAGNWLYFLPLELLNDLRLPRDQLLCIYQYYHRTLLRAHFGQALDLGGRVDALSQYQIHEVCLASMRLKTGALMGFAVTLGGWLAGASERVLSILYEFGSELGVALQMFDDVGNVMSDIDPAKRYEDIFLYRPSWIWACAARRASGQEFDEFVSAARALPEADALQQWLKRHRLIEHARELAWNRLSPLFDRLQEELEAEQIQCSKDALGELYELGRNIAVAYG